MASRSFVEGLFGVIPDLLENTLIIRPGLPVEWDHASLKTPDISFVFKRIGNKENYTIIPTLPKPVKLKFRATAKGELVKSVTVNGKSVSWTNVDQAIEYPQIEITTAVASKFDISIEWQGSKTELVKSALSYGLNEILTASFGKAKVLEIFDPQKALKQSEIKDNSLKAIIIGEKGNRKIFAKVKQGQFTWWAPVCFEIKETLDITASLNQEKNSLKFAIQNNTGSLVNAKVTVNPGEMAYITNSTIQAGGFSAEISVPFTNLIDGSNRVRVEWANEI